MQPETTEFIKCVKLATQQNKIKYSSSLGKYPTLSLNWYSSLLKIIFEF